MVDINDDQQQQIYMHLNEETDKCISTMQRDVNYETIEKASKMVLENFYIEHTSNKKNTIKMPIERTMQVVLEFFKTIDESLYNKVKEIIERKCETELRIYNLSEVENFDERTEDGFALHTDWPCIETNGKKSVIHIHKNENLKDLYAIVHEISHTFCNSGSNVYKAMFVESQSMFFEKLLSKFLIEKINNNQLNEEVINIEKEKFADSYRSAYEMFIKTRFCRIKQNKGIISNQDVYDFQNEVEGTNIQILNRICDRENNANYGSRYVMGELISSQMMEMYEQDPDKMIKKLKGYFEHINNGSLDEALGIFDINFDENSLNSLILKTKKVHKNIIKTKNDIVVEDGVR